MKEIVIISGKGGTGKTSIAASFATLATNAVFADCDVDAADLHLILSPQSQKVNEFYSGYEAIIDVHKCMKCGECYKVCRFEAVKKKNACYQIDPLDCEGCCICHDFCRYNAIELKERLCGEWYLSDTRFGPMVHAKLDIGAENSGKLVTMVRNEAKKAASEKNAEMILIDGPPGIGCPVIASITGADAIVAVTEPTLSGKHDLGRVIELAAHFKIPLYLCVNKYDINVQMTEIIEENAKKLGAILLGRISYDREVTEAQINGKSVVEWNQGQASKEIKNIWEKLCSQI
ncbi:MAG TPA: (4Fe-4S)-binding protein [Lentisphaeria bacterium]|nr:MAG: (4Fe-4S)-binding protein [Lentisphaerae bacterium GWF2_38_69]HBM15764.1 (4Fe-4S)-binding protein [Lentisphaeria bacterium]